MPFSTQDYLSETSLVRAMGAWPSRCTHTGLAGRTEAMATVLQFSVSAVQQSHGGVWVSVAVTETPVSKPWLVGTEKPGTRPLS